MYGLMMLAILCLLGLYVGMADVRTDDVGNLKSSGL